MNKIRVNVASLPILAQIDETIRRCDLRGPIARIQDIAAALAGHFFRKELDDLIGRHS